MANRRLESGGGACEFVTARELAEKWKCHVRTVGRILGRAGIEPVVFSPGRNGLKRFRRADVDRFLDERAS